MSVFQIINKMIKSVLGAECKHIHINQFNSGTHCQDCGKIVKTSWITIKCQQCKALRMPKRTNLSKIIPNEKHCIQCGSEKWFSNRSENLNFSEYMYGILLKELTEEENASVQSTTDVWVEQSENSEAKRSSNVIKAYRRFK